MLFNSIEFIIFFPLVTLIYFALPHRFRWLHLLLSSCVFYMFFIPVYIFILSFTIIIDYYAGMFIEQALDRRRKKTWLVLSICANVGVLAVFKYYNFFIENVNQLLGHDASFTLPYLQILLPVGLSFHTFQAMSYTIEVYRGNQKAERHFGIYALYVMFYPQLVAGPIERPQNMLHQFYERHEFDYHRVVSGLRLMLWGLFKKVVVADNLVHVVNTVYGDPTHQNSLTYLIAAVFFSFQIYCDFSGYSDIARGSARVMGFSLMENFKLPFISQSIREFWSRWHISLSTWFRDYLYIPLGGSRVPKWMHCLNLMIVFLVSGLWHGANWTFVIWGALHGIAMIFGTLFLFSARKTGGLFPFLRTLAVFAFVTLVWVFFRAESAHTALEILKTIASGFIPDLRNYLEGKAIFNGLGEFTIHEILWMSLLIALFFIADISKEKRSIKDHFLASPLWRMACYFVLFYSLVFIGYWGNTQFIYFQF
ncbi:MAG: MBOAT family O-acyltransferase [Bacteroidia bacterium]